MIKLMINDCELQSFIRTLASALPVKINGQEEFKLALSSPGVQELLFNGLASLYLKFGAADHSIIKIHNEQKAKARAEIKRIAESERTKAKVLMRTYCFPGAICGEDNYLRVKVLSYDDDLNIKTEVIANKCGWENVCNIGEILTWKHINTYIWEAKPDRPGAQSLMFIESDGVSFDRDS